MKRRTHRPLSARRFALAALLAGVAWTGSSALATTYTWLGTDSNAWTDGANWQGGMAPPSDLLNTDLLFGNSGGPYPSINASYSVHSLTWTNNANAFIFDTGPLTVGAGGFTQNAANAQAFGAQVILGADQTWTLGSGAGALTFGGGVNTTNAGNNYALTINAATTSASGNVVNGAINGGGSLTKTGAGTLTLTGASTYTGGTTVNAGTLQIGSGGSLGATDISVGAGAALNLVGTGTLTGTSNNLTLDGSATAPATGTLSSTGTSYRGTVTVGFNGVGSLTQTAGTLNVDQNGNLILGLNAGSSGTYNLQGGSLSTGSVLVGHNGSGTFNQTGGSFSTNGQSFSVSSIYGVATYNLQSGSLSTGNVFVGGDGNGYYGSGTFNQTGGSFSTNGQSLFVDSIQGSPTFNLQGGSLSTGNTIVGYYGSGTFNQMGGSFSTNGNILALGNTTYGSGTYTLGGGTLSTGRVAGGGTSTFHFAGGTLQASVSTTSFFQGLTTADVQAGGAKIDTQAYNVTVAQSLVHDTSANAAAIDGGLTKQGAGILTLSGANTYTGSTTVSAGTLNLANAGALQNSTLTLSSGGGAVNFDASVSSNGNAFTLGGLSGNGNLALANNAANPAAVALSVGNNNVDTTYSGVLSGAGSLTKLGTGTLTLSGNNTYTGTTTISAGTLQAGSGGTAGNLGSGNVVNNGALAFNRSDNVTVANAISGTGSLTKLGAGTLTLTGNNTYTGNNTVLGGTLVLPAGAASSVGANVAAGATLVYSGATVTPGFNSLTAQPGGTIQFTGGTRLNGGDLDGAGSYQLGTGGATFTGTTVNNGTSVIVAGGPAIFRNVASSGAVSVAAGQTLAWNGGSNALGTLTVDGKANTSGWTSTGVNTIDNGGTLANSGSNLVLGGGSRTTINSGGTLSAASGTTVELNGALLVNNGTQTGTLNVNYGSTLKGAGTFGTVNVTDGGRFSPGNSPGTATVSSLNLQAAGTYQFELNSAVAANNAPGNHADLISVSQLLTISAGTTANSRFTVALVSLDADDHAAALSDFDSSKSYRFVLATAGADITGFNPAEFTVDTSGFANGLAGGSFAVVQDGNNLDLVFTSAVPEPGTWASVGLGSLLLLGRTIRRACSAYSVAKRTTPRQPRNSI